VSHPGLHGAKVHTTLEMLRCKGRAEFVQEPVVSARTIGAGMITLVAVAAVERGRQSSCRDRGNDSSALHRRSGTPEGLRRSHGRNLSRKSSRRRLIRNTNRRCPTADLIDFFLQQLSVVRGRVSAVESVSYSILAVSQISDPRIEFCVLVASRSVELVRFQHLLRSHFIECRDRRSFSLP
jgi:hypothetical protein